MIIKKNKKNTNKSNWFSYVVLAVVLLIPFMYSFFYLKAYWDPYGHMDDIPVAIVNEDKTVEGQNKGKDLVDSLKKKNTLDISVVNKNKADRTKFEEQLKEFTANVIKTFKIELNERGCVGSIAEIYDSKRPYEPKGAIAQAWSVAEVFRIISEN